MSEPPDPEQDGLAALAEHEHDLAVLDPRVHVASRQGPRQNEYTVPRLLNQICNAYADWFEDARPVSTPVLGRSHVTSCVCSIGKTK